MSIKEINKKLYIQNLTTGKIKEIPYFNELYNYNQTLFKEILFLELDKALEITDSIKLFVTYN